MQVDNLWNILKNEPMNIFYNSISDKDYKDYYDDDFDDDYDTNKLR